VRSKIRPFVPILILLLVQSAVLAQQAGQGAGSDPSIEARLRALEERLAERDRELDLLRETLAEEREAPAVQAAGESAWYERISLRGYAQFRYTTLLGEDHTPDLHVPNDPTVDEAQTFYIRRGRFILSGDVTERVYLYAQYDFNGSVGGSGSLGLQMRDLYADIAFDEAREFRVRVGQSKVPFGFVNLQSSQNRAPMERPDAINSAAEGERDVGAFFYWAPREIRDRFRKLVRSGLKGSGDYGVFGIGAYSGQGPNRADRNGEVHTVVRLSYPFEFDSGQIVELGTQAYTGRFVPSTEAIGGRTPTVAADGVRDERAALTAVVYPQPIGIEAEWSWGRGPELEADGASIGVHALRGGYLQLNYRLEGADSTVWFPFLRWNRYDGARKFARNAPPEDVDELDLGLEWSPRPEIELAAMYTHTFVRTNTTAAPYADVRDADRIGFQLQWNF
jgi:hypothetical protein